MIGLCAILWDLSHLHWKHAHQFIRRQVNGYLAGTSHCTCTEYNGWQEEARRILPSTLEVEALPPLSAHFSVKTRWSNHSGAAHNHSQHITVKNELPVMQLANPLELDAEKLFVSRG